MLALNAGAGEMINDAVSLGLVLSSLMVEVVGSSV